MKVFVTGVAGAIGSHLAERLVTEGHEVTGIDALTDYYSPQIKKINTRDVEEKGVRVIFKNLAKDNFDEELSGAEVIFHCAAQPGISATTPFEDYLANNIIATHNLVESAKKLKEFKLFVNVSTSSIYGERAASDEEVEPKPTSYYGVTKLAAEQLVLAEFRNSGFPATSLRLFSVYGERERPEKFFHRLIKAMHEGGEVPLYEGSEHHIRSYTYVGDIIDAFVLVLENRDKVIGEIFNIGNDQTATTLEGLKIVEEIIGKKAKLKIMPKRSGDQLETAAQISKARNILGFNPKISLKDGLAREIKWYGEKIYEKLPRES